MRTEPLRHRDLAPGHYGSQRVLSLAELVLSDSTVRLFFLAIASLVIYQWGFVNRYGLYEWWRVTGVTIGKISNYDPRAGAAYIVGLLALFLIYWLAYRLAAQAPRRPAWAVVIGGAIAFNLSLMSLYPVDSSDVFDNIMHARITEVYGANVFYQAPIGFKSDPFYRYTAWIYYPSAYGPLWESVAAGAARLAGNGIVANVLVFKGISILAYAATAAVVALTLRRNAPQRALYGVTLFAWNPLVLYSTAGNAHNDVVMMLFISLGMYWVTRGNYTLAALAETAGALIKFIPALLLPLILVAGLKQMSGWRARTRFAMITLALCAVLVVGFYSFYFRGGDILGVARRSDLFTTSLSTLVRLLFPFPLQAKFASLLITLGSLILVSAWVIRQVRQVWRGDKEAPVRAAVSVLLFYLLIAAPWFEAWYAIWPLALVALLPDGIWSRGSILFSLAAGWKMPLFEFVMMARPGALPPAAYVEPRATFGTLGLPWVFFIIQSLKANLGLKR